MANRYQWSQEFQGIILSSMFWGNILSKLPGGIGVQLYGGKVILLIAVFLSAIVLTITPLAVAYGELVHTFKFELLFFIIFFFLNFKFSIELKRRCLWIDHNTNIDWIFAWS